MIRITTERLVIRNFEDKDAAGLWDIIAHPRADCFVDEALNTSGEETVLELIRKRENELHVAVCLKEDDTLIGNIFTAKEEPDTYSIGWQFKEKYEGKGYANESAAAFFDFLFATQNVRRISAYVDEENIRSQKLCERLGMRKEGRFMEFISFVKNPDGTPKYENTLVYAILKKEWTTPASGSVHAS